MKSKTTLMFIALSLLGAILFSSAVSAVVLAEWQLTTDGSPSNVNADITAGVFSFGSGVTSPEFGANGASAGSWSLSAEAGGSGTLEADSYFQITIMPDAGKSVTINKIDFGERRSESGIANYQVQWSKNAAFTSPTTISTVSVPDNGDERDASISGLNILVNSGETLYVRWFGYNAEGGVGTWRINDATLKVEGTVGSGSGGTSALTITKGATPLTTTQSTTITIENTGTTTLSNIALSQTGDFTVALTPAGSFTLTPSGTTGSTKTVTVSVADADQIDFGSNTVTISATSGNVIAQTQFAISGSFCVAGPQGGSLEITDINIENNGDGDDEEWKLLDTIEIEVDVENTGDEDVDDVIVELGIFDSSGDNLVNDLEFDNADEEEVDLGDLNDGDEETVTFTFRIPADVTDGNYDVVVKAYGDSSDVGEDMECAMNDNIERVSIDKEDDEGKFIAFEEIVITPSEATCGERVVLSTDVFNIGDEDQDQVRINLVNNALGLDESFEIRSDLNEGDKEEVTFDFTVPQNAENQVYNLELSADYDFSRNSYRASSDEDTSVSLRVLGCTDSMDGGSGDGNGQIASVTASLESDAVAGQQLVVNAVVTNLQSGQATIIVGASDYQGWGDLSDISDRVLNLGAGESEEVTFTFDVNEDVSGEESFTIDISSGQQTEEKEVAVNIEAASGGASFDLGDNAYLWIIGLINVVLIILIIVVAVRISRR